MTGEINVPDAAAGFGASSTVRVRGEAVRMCGDPSLGHWLLGRLADTPVPAPHARRWLACVREDVSQPGGTPECYAEAESGASAPDAAWLPLVWEPGALLIGPLGTAGTLGCPRCAWLRHHRHLTRLPASEGPYPQAPPPGAVLEVAAALLADELDPHGEPRTRGALLRVGTGRGEVTRHPVLPDPECPRCGPLLPGAELDPVPGTAPVPPGRLRGLSGSEAATAAELFVDPLAGLVHEVRERAEGGRPVAVAVRDPAYDTVVSYHGYGHGDDFRSARTSAVLEALERLGGVPTPDALRRRGPTASYREVAGNAVYPPSFGLHPEESYARPGFPYVPWSAALETEWAWGRSLTRNRAVLVPAALVHYAEPHPARARFVQEFSNGCALGGSLTEAVLHGLLEVAERDAFLATWYARLPLTRIDLAAAGDRRVQVLAAWARERAGCELMAFDATLEQGVPAVWVMSVAGPEAVGQPAVLCGAAARLSTGEALTAAFDELVCTLLAPPRLDLERAAGMLRDPFAVRAMGDHELLYAHPRARERLAFLRTDGERVAPGELDAARRWPVASDLGAHVAELVRRYAADGLEVVVVDQTRPEHRAGGLRCVKVLVPGTLPMTFGHAERRLEGLSRVRTLPRTLGFRADALAEDEINPHPHPFP